MRWVDVGGILIFLGGVREKLSASRCRKVSVALVTACEESGRDGGVVGLRD